MSRERHNVEAILEAVTRVYPEEAQTPAGFTTGLTLRPYQRQSLAFMLNVERRTGGELPPLGRARHARRLVVRRGRHGQDRGRHRLCLAHPSTHKSGSDAAGGPSGRLLTRTPRWLGRYPTAS